MMLCFNVSDIAIITVKGVDYGCFIHDISKSGSIYLLEICAWWSWAHIKMYISENNIKNQVCNCYFDNLIKAEKLEPKRILIDERNYKNLVI